MVEKLSQLLLHGLTERLPVLFDEEVQLIQGLVVVYGRHVQIRDDTAGAANDVRPEARRDEHQYDGNLEFRRVRRADVPVFQRKRGEEAQEREEMSGEWNERKKRRRSEQRSTHSPRW